MAGRSLTHVTCRSIWSVGGTIAVGLFATFLLFIYPELGADLSIGRLFHLALGTLLLLAASMVFGPILIGVAGVSFALYFLAVGLISLFAAESQFVQRACHTAPGDFEMIRALLLFLPASLTATYVWAQLFRGNALSAGGALIVVVGGTAGLTGLTVGAERIVRILICTP